jgi:AcrR family transcriptional regulator
VIKRVGGRAYRYRVESYRDPETRRVRGKWTYLGRVEGEGTLSPERQARPSSRSRLLDALERLLETHDTTNLSTGMVAHEAGLAYGTFYRYFKDLDHIVREAVLRHDATSARLREALAVDLGDADTERDKVVAWLEEVVASAQAKPGLVRAWHIASNVDAAVVAERQARFDRDVESFVAYMKRLKDAGLGEVSSPQFNAYALVALITAVVRECAVEKTFNEDKLAGIVEVVTDLMGFPPRVAQELIA